MSGLSSSGAAGPGTAVTDLARRGDTAEHDGELLEAIELLTRANGEQADATLEYRLVSLRRRAFAALEARSKFANWPPAPSRAEYSEGVVPSVDAAELTAEVLRRHILTEGCLHVRGVADSSTVQSLAAGIDRALDEWGSLKRPYLTATGSPWFDPLAIDEPERSGLGRTWVTNSGGLLTADSPRMLFALLDTLEGAGLRDVARDYLGERPALSANKCTIRRVPVDTNADWHQDGAFLGKGIRALNIWLALDDCGRDAPGLDIVPRRLDHIVETGTHGSYFDWAVGPDLVPIAAGATPVVRPEFAAGDALLFDDLMLHCTATDPSMTRSRHAIETWCFAPSAYPSGHVPIVW
jgi:hypothetical protein